MASDANEQVNGQSDAQDRLIRAGEPLLGLHLRCGGEMPGIIAIPGLLELVRKARIFGMKIARPFAMQDGAETVTAWVEIEPQSGDGGCQIHVRHWLNRTAPPVDESAALRQKLSVDRDVAEYYARLDANQNVLIAQAMAPDLDRLAKSMQSGTGQLWLGFVSVEGWASANQPLHWRLLDGASVRVEGSTRPWRVTLVPHGDSGGKPTAFDLYLTSDVPIAATVRPERREVRGNGRMISQDVAPVLRQPIARIIANAETIRTRLAGPLAEEYSNYAADIATAGQHLLALVDDLTDLEVVEAEDFSTAPDAIDLADVARRAAGILGVRAREQGIVIDAPRVGESQPAVAEFRRVLQILLNLLGNAIRYSPPHSQVWLRLSQEGGMAQVIVADQGPGLDPEQQTRVFEKFERLGRSGDGGSGLGLYISRRLARAMGGDLTVESAPGQGARFILSVPEGDPA